MTRKDVLIIQAPFLMTKENMEKTYNQFVKQMESGLLMLPSGYTVIQCPKDIDVKFSGDAISRKAVLEGLASIAKTKAKSDAQKSMMGRMMFFVEQLPFVSTEKTGRWIRWYEVIESADGKSTDHIPHCKCSECNCEYDTYSAQFIKYCPECGAKMGVEE